MHPHPITRNLPIIVGIALPLIFIVIVALVAYLPTLTVKPNHDFLYAESDGSSYYSAYLNQYSIENGRLVTIPASTGQVDSGRPMQEAPRLYYYDIRQDVAREISRSEAASLVLTPGPSSPDGYIVEYRYNSSGVFGLLGGGSSRAQYVISKNGAEKPLPALQSQSYGYRDSYEVIGWVN